MRKTLVGLVLVSTLGCAAHGPWKSETLERDAVACRTARPPMPDAPFKSLGSYLTWREGQYRADEVCMARRGWVR